MERERIAGQVIAIDLDRHMEVSESHARQRAMKQLADRVGSQFPDCGLCKNLKLHEEMDHMLYRRKYAVTCGSKPVYPGSTITCPDGFVGRIDQEEKKFMAIKPTFRATVGWPAASSAFSKDEFEREYMTSPYGTASGSASASKITLEEIMKAKIQLEHEGEGVSKISAGLDSLLRPATRIPSDASDFIKRQEAELEAQRKKDVPATVDGDAW